MFRQAVFQLKGKTLGCFCKPNPCHGDVLGAMAEGTDIRPIEDGVTHINAYSKSRTRLGRMLSNFTKSPFELEGYGRWASIEGLWYALSVQREVWDTLRPLHGFKAKKVGRELRKTHPLPQTKTAGDDWTLESQQEFRDTICAALRAKLRDNSDIREALRDSGSLPIRHYYFYGDVEGPSPPKVTEPTQGRWIWQHYERLRAELQTIKLMVTGHRIKDFNPEQKAWVQGEIKRILTMAVARASQQNQIIEVISGGAIGVDQWFAEAALELAIPVHFYLPFPGYDSKWPQAVREHYAGLRAQAKSVNYGGDSFSYQLYHQRNHDMVDAADWCISVWNGKTSGGTYACTQYIRKTQKWFYHINPKTMNSRWRRTDV